MARFGYQEAEKYGGTGGSGFFSIANDKEVKKVRFLYNTSQDIEGYAVHEVEVNGKKRYVNCLRDYNDSIDKCPFCEAGRVQQVKAFIPLFDVKEGNVKIWERGKKFFGRLSGLCARYPSLVSQEFEIQRNGAKGSKDTTYDIMPSLDHPTPDGTTIESLVDEIPKIVGGIVLDKSYEEMKAYLNTGSFPSSNATSNNDYVRRTPSTRDSF